MTARKTGLALLRWVPAIFITSVSWYLSDQPTIEHMPSFWNADKLVHLVCFGGLSFWAAFGCRIRRPGQFWLPALLVSVYGVIDEFHQSFTPGRSTSFFDWMADTAGAVMGALVFVGVVGLIERARGIRAIKENTSSLRE